LTNGLQSNTMHAYYLMTKQNFETGFLLNRASFALGRYLNRSFAKRKLDKFSTSFLGVMRCLWEKDSQSLTELAKEIGLEASSMTGLIDRMEKAGLVKRQSDPRDRRIWRIQLTRKGRDLRPVISEIVEDTYSTLTRGISVGDLDGIKRGLNKLIDNAGFKIEGIEPKKS
jgi:MarR family transcriptional regulator, organic hydroperoxide resistance regulator